eukprot:2913180-Rhodomonas_salina.1
MSSEIAPCTRRKLGFEFCGITWMKISTALASTPPRAVPPLSRIVMLKLTFPNLDSVSSSQRYARPSAHLELAGCEHATDEADAHPTDIDAITPNGPEVCLNSNSTVCSNSAQPPLWMSIRRGSAAHPLAP